MLLFSYILLQEYKKTYTFAKEILKDSIVLFVVKPVRVMTIIKKPVRVYNKRYG